MKMGHLWKVDSTFLMKATGILLLVFALSIGVLFLLNGSVQAMEAPFGEGIELLIKDSLDSILAGHDSGAGQAIAQGNVINPIWVDVN
jgi:hypothetical protein